MVIQTIDNISYKLRYPFDMSYISRYGKVFKVFDDQDSGNICFGVQKDEWKYFIKFAGAKTAEYAGDTKDAVARLENAVPVYKTLDHKNLIELIYAEKIGEGLAMVFEWTDAVCIGNNFPDPGYCLTDRYRI